jgi:hypothetical protein
LNNFSNQFQEIISDAAKKSLRIKKTKYRNKITNVCNKKWFDKECRLKRHSKIRKKYHEALKIYKDTLKHKKEIFHEKKLQDLEIAAETDPNSFWKNLKDMSDSCDDLSSS